MINGNESNKTITKVHPFMMARDHMNQVESKKEEKKKNAIDIPKKHTMFKHLCFRPKVGTIDSIGDMDEFDETISELKRIRSIQRA